MRDLGISKERASALAGQSPKRAGQWLHPNHTVIPNSTALHRLAQRLGTTVDRLFDGSLDVPKTDGDLSALPEILSSTKRLIEISNAKIGPAFEFMSRDIARAVFQLWLEADTKIDGRFEQLLPYIDSFLPDLAGGEVNILHVGPKGLAAPTLEDGAVEPYLRHIRGLPDADHEEFNNSLASVTRYGRSTISCKERKVPVDGQRTPKDVRFVRIHLPGKLF
ncbi:MAG: hypothetical protein QNJ44_16280 [Rhodobacter sp.]|nr:hypothetical protein [Rhodobacter sp.]